MTETPNARVHAAADPTPLQLVLRIGAAGVLSGFILASTSYLINELWLGEAHDALDVFRPDDHPLIIPGLMVSSIVWGCLLAGGYRLFWGRRTGRPGWLEGARYGALVCVFFTLIQSLFLFQFIRLSTDLLIGDLLHQLLASTLAGAVIGVVVPRPTAPQGSDVAA